MKTTKRLLQLLCAAFILAAPVVAQAQAFPFPPSYGPYGPAFGPVVTPLPGISGLFGEALENTPLDPYATTVHVVPPTGGTVMLYRGNALRGWWMQPGLVTVQPDAVYSLVATRGTSVLYASGIVFRPGYTAIAWAGGTLPQIAYQPAWPMGYPGGRYAARPHGHGHEHGGGAEHPASAPPSRQSAAPDAGGTAEPALSHSIRRQTVKGLVHVPQSQSVRPSIAPRSIRAKRAAVNVPSESGSSQSSPSTKKAEKKAEPSGAPQAEQAPAKLPAAGALRRTAVARRVR